MFFSKYLQSPFYQEEKQFIGALAFEALRSMVITNDKVTKQEIVLKGYLGVKDVKTTPDGALYILLNQPEIIIRLTPTDSRKKK